MPEKETTILDYDGNEVDVRVVGASGDSARMEIEHPDDREWVVVVDDDGEVGVEVTRRDGTPADLAVPEWLEDNMSRLARPA
jgi:hypothetical protein